MAFSPKRDKEPDTHSSLLKRIPGSVWLGVLLVANGLAGLLLFQTCDSSTTTRVDESRFNPKSDSTSVEDFFMLSQQPIEAPEPVQEVIVDTTSLAEEDSLVEEMPAEDSIANVAIEAEKVATEPSVEEIGTVEEMY